MPYFSVLGMLDDSLVGQQTIFCSPVQIQFPTIFSWIEINWHFPPPPPFWQVQNALRAPTIERCASSAASPVSSGCLSPQKLRGKWSLRPGTHPVTTLPTEDLKMLTGVSRKFFPQE